MLQSFRIWLSQKLRLTTQSYSAAKITPAVTNVYAMDNHVINCVLTDLPSHYSGVKWSPASPLANSYTLADGNHVGTTQTSSLTISSYQLQVLMLKSDSHTEIFTCEIRVGSSNTPVRATQQITIYNPSK